MLKFLQHYLKQFRNQQNQCGVLRPYLETSLTRFVLKWSKIQTSKFHITNCFQLKLLYMVVLILAQGVKYECLKGSQPFLFVVKIPTKGQPTPGFPWPKNKQTKESASWLYHVTTIFSFTIGLCKLFMVHHFIAYIQGESIF